MPTPQHITPKRRSPKPSHLPAKTTHIATKTALSAPIYPHASPSIPTQVSGNGRKREEFRKNNVTPCLTRGPTVLPNPVHFVAGTPLAVPSM